MRRWISATDISGLDRPLVRLSDQCPSRISQSHIPRCLHNIYTIYVVYCILTEWVCMPIQTFFRWVRAQFWGIKLSLLARANRTQKKNQVETLAELEYGVKTNIDVVKTHGQTVGTLSILWSFYGSLWWV